MGNIKIIYVHSKDDKEVIGEVLTNRGLTIEEVLNIACVYMDEYAREHGWEDWDPNSLELEY